MNINGNEENVPILGRSVTFSRGLPPVAAAVPAQAATNSTGQTLGAPARTYAPTQRFIQKLVGTKTAANNRVRCALHSKLLMAFFNGSLRFKSGLEGLLQ